MQLVVWLKYDSFVNSTCQHFHEIIMWILHLENNTTSSAIFNVCNASEKASSHWWIAYLILPCAVTGSTDVLSQTYCIITGLKWVFRQWLFKLRSKYSSQCSVKLCLIFHLVAREVNYLLYCKINGGHVFYLHVRNSHQFLTRSQVFRRSHISLDTGLVNYTICDLKKEILGRLEQVREGVAVKTCRRSTSEYLREGEYFRQGEPRGC